MADLSRSVLIRAWQPDDDLERLTALVHAAYAPQAAKGLRFWGAFQSVADTAERLAAGHALLALDGGSYAGTITVRPPHASAQVPLYAQPRTWTLSQFAVSPLYKGRGLGKALHDAALAHAVAQGAATMALDTAAPAVALIAMYRAWGYVQVGECDWRPKTNYSSIVMARPLGDGPAPKGQP